MKWVLTIQINKDFYWNKFCLRLHWFITLVQEASYKLIFLRNC